MANSNSYGWVQPISAVPQARQFANSGGGQQASTNGGFNGQGGYQVPQQAGMYGTMSGGGTDVGGPSNPYGPSWGTPQGPYNIPNGLGGNQPTPWNNTPNSYLGQWGGKGSPSDLLQNIASGGNNIATPGQWTGQNRDLLESYMGNFFTPFVNAQNAQEAQRFNEYNAGQQMSEQQRVNSGQMDIAQQAQNLQRQGFDFASGPQFQQAISQFNQQQGLANTTQQNTNAYQMGQNQYNAANVANQYKLGNQANQNTAQNNAWNYSLGQGANQNQSQANANTAQNNAWNYNLGQGANSNQATQNANTLQLGMGQNQNAANQNANTLALGQGQLGYQNRQLDTTNAFNQQQLAQDAALTREKYGNDLTQARYAAFGRAQQPNSRAALSWH